MATESTKSVTVPEQLKAGFIAGTAARSDAKKVSAYAKYIASTAVGIALLLWMIGAFIPYIKEKGPAAPSSAVATAPAVQNAASPLEGQVSWDKLEADGSAPVGVWSGKLSGRPGCSVTLTHDPSFAREYQYNSTTWVAYVPGTSPDFTAWRFKATEPGKSVPMYKFKC